MKLLQVMFLIAILNMIACANVMVNMKRGNAEFNYSLPYENGYIFDKDGRQEVLLTFHRKNKWFQFDTAERLHLYIVNDEKANLAKGGFSNNAKAFFVRVQLRSVYGYLEIKEMILTKKDNGKAIYISGYFVSDKIQPERHLVRSLNLKISNLPLRQVDSYDEIDVHDTDYFKKIVQEEFFTDWKP